MLIIIGPACGTKLGILLCLLIPILTSPNNRLFRLERNLSLTQVAVLSSDLGDLTSCNFPLFILPSSLTNFSAITKAQSVYLDWNGEESTSSTIIEHSVDGSTWKKLAEVAASTEKPKAGQFTHVQPAKVRIITG